REIHPQRVLLGQADVGEQGVIAEVAIQRLLENPPGGLGENFTAALWPTALQRRHHGTGSRSMPKTVGRDEIGNRTHVDNFRIAYLEPTRQEPSPLWSGFIFKRSRDPL